MKLRLPRRRRYRIYIYILSTLLVALAIDLIWVRVWRHITISEATTHITSPLKPDGMPDYLQYLDNRQREGVTAENNAVIPFLEMMPADGGGDGGWYSPDRLPEFYERLGVTTPPKGQPIVNFADILKAKTPPDFLNGDRTKEAEFVMKNPWTREEHPDIARYLDANESALAVVPRVIARPRWYMPMLRPKTDLLMSVLLPSLGHSRERCNELITRAMLEIHEKKFAQARADIMAVHRLARLHAQGWTIIEHLVAVAEDRLALDADAAFAAAEGLPREELQKFIAEWDTLKPLESITRSLDSDRSGLLDALIYASKHPSQATSLFMYADSVDAPDLFAGSLKWLEAGLRPANFNAAMQEVNVMYDQFVDASRAPTALEREDKMNLAANAVQAYCLNHKYSDPARRAVAMLLPALDRAVVIADIREMRAVMARTALALAAYKAEKGAYPDRLQDLTPQFLPTVPADIFRPAGEPLAYRKTEKGFIAYSIGSDRKDEGGKIVTGSQYKGDLVVEVK